MSEFVEKSMEEMVPELRKMEKLKLFTREELRKLVKNRKSLEYKLRRKTKELNDYLKYIEYEMNVLKLLKNRRKASHCQKMVKNVDVSILKRIHKLFQLACRRFPENIMLWIKHIEFCKAKNEKSRIVALFSEVLKLHPHKSSLWVLAAKHEMDDVGSTLNARNLMQKAIRLNPDDKYLYLEYFRLELLSAEKIKKRAKCLEIEQEEDSALKNEEIAKVIFKNAKKTFPEDIELFVNFLEIAKLFSFAPSVMDAIYNELETYESNALAQSVCIMRLFDVNKADFDIKVSVKNVISAFQKVLACSSSDLLYEKFSENLLNISESYGVYDLVKYALFNLYEDALNKNLLTESMALKWITLPEISELNILTEKLIDKFPTNIVLRTFQLNNDLLIKSNIWIVDYLSCYTNKLNTSEDVLQLWKIAFDYYSINLVDLKTLYLKGSISENRYVSQYVKAAYFEIFTLHKHISKIRKLYKKMTNQMPFPIDVVFKYLDAELVQVNVDVDNIRKSFESAVVWFGVDNIEIWQRYISFEKNSRYGKAENVGLIYERAVKYLNDELANEFIANYTMTK